MKIHQWYKAGEKEIEVRDMNGSVKIRKLERNNRDVERDSDEFGITERIAGLIETCWNITPSPYDVLFPIARPTQFFGKVTKKNPESVVKKQLL